MRGETGMNHWYEKDISGCGLIGFIHRDGYRVSGETIRKAISVMIERGNGLGAGFAAYGIYPQHRDSYAFHLMYRTLKKALTPKTALFILCNPHNPTGRVYHRNELLQLFEICHRHNIVILSDEIHCQLILDPEKRHIPFASLGAEFEDATITLMAPSKTYNIPGLACSFAIIPNKNLRRRFKAVKSGIIPEVNVMGYVAALAAYKESGQWLKELLNYLCINRDLVQKAVSGMPKMTTSHVEATYLAWIDACQIGVKNPVLFFEKSGVGLSDGKYFGAPGYVRLNFGCPRTQLDKALQRMQKALEKIVR